MGKAKIKPSIHRIKPYSPGVSTHDTGTPLVKMSSNENPYGPSPQAVEAVKRGSDSINLYPDKEARRLRESLSQLLGIPREAIWVGNGSDDVLQNLAKLYLSEGDNLVTHSPFSTYNTVAASMGAERKLVRMPPDAGIDVEALERACDDRTRIVVVCTPNNPTGAILEPGSMQDILGFTEAHGICLVVDEAYADFSDRYESPIRMLVEDDLDVVVTRTFSKAYGLAGLRIGFGVARPEVVRYSYPGYGSPEPDPREDQTGQGGPRKQAIRARPPTPAVGGEFHHGICGEIRNERIGVHRQALGERLRDQGLHKLRLPRPREDHRRDPGDERRPPGCHQKHRRLVGQEPVQVALGPLPAEFQWMYPPQLEAVPHQEAPGLAR